MHRCFDTWSHLSSRPMNFFWSASFFDQRAAKSSTSSSSFLRFAGSLATGVYGLSGGSSTATSSAVQSRDAASKRSRFSSWAQALDGTRGAVGSWAPSGVTWDHRVSSSNRDAPEHVEARLLLRAAGRLVVLRVEFQLLHGLVHVGVGPAHLGLELRAAEDERLFGRRRRALLRLERALPVDLEVDVRGLEGRGGARGDELGLGDGRAPLAEALLARHERGHARVPELALVLAVDALREAPRRAVDVAAPELLGALDGPDHHAPLQARDRRPLVPVRAVAVPEPVERRVLEAAGLHGVAADVGHLRAREHRDGVAQHHVHVDLAPEVHVEVDAGPGRVAQLLGALHELRAVDRGLLEVGLALRLLLRRAREHRALVRRRLRRRQDAVLVVRVGRVAGQGHDAELALPGRAQRPAAVADLRAAVLRPLLARRLLGLRRVVDARGRREGARAVLGVLDAVEVDRVVARRLEVVEAERVDAMGAGYSTSHKMIADRSLTRPITGPSRHRTPP
mmetsp:Transcript_17819/g.57935  ORF Transcript_17819/g.57935 Transcript_17819/m.57935 type:complete len:509 (-) Transcript_17819:673-2199(-)